MFLWRRTLSVVKRIKRPYRISRADSDTRGCDTVPSHSILGCISFESEAYEGSYALAGKDTPAIYAGFVKFRNKILNEVLMEFFDMYVLTVVGNKSEFH